MLDLHNKQKIPFVECYFNHDDDDDDDDNNNNNNYYYYYYYYYFYAVCRNVDSLGIRMSAIEFIGLFLQLNII